jgi:prolyl-tRNA editing enzyme YbaK/EbsC (Cys-tRNA(Pro) deacylase)
LPVYAEKSIFTLASILINAGKRGALAELDPEILKKLLPVTEVEVAR